MAYFVKAHNIAYFPVPKIACTSVKQMFYFLENGCYFKEYHDENGIYRHIHDKRFGGNLTTPFEEQRDLETATRVALVRDPLDRFASAYANRVLIHKELSPKAREGTKAAALNLKPDPNFAEFVNNLEGYRYVSNTIRHHTDPMSYFLGPDLGYYHKLYRMDEIAKLRDDIKQLSGIDCGLPHEQRSAVRFTPPDRSAPLWKKIAQFYSGDYALLKGIYSPRRTFSPSGAVIIDLPQAPPR